VFDCGLHGQKAVSTHLQLAVGCLLDEFKNDIKPKPAL